MAGTTWPTLTAGAIARASDVVNRFQWMEGSLVPMSGGSATDNAFDLGSVTSNWRTVYAYSINGTSTAKGLAIGTTTVQNQSDVALEIAGIRAVLMPRLTTTQRTNLAGINGMEVYDSTLNQFFVYQAGSWQVMLGAPIGFATPIGASVTSTVTTTVASISAPGRLLRLMSINSVGGGSITNVEAVIDSAIFGDFPCATTTVMFLAPRTDTFLGGGLVPGHFLFTNTSTLPYEMGIFFKSSLVIYQRAGGGSTAQTTITYERT